MGAPTVKPLASAWTAATVTGDLAPAWAPADGPAELSQADRSAAAKRAATANLGNFIMPRTVGGMGRRYQSRRNPAREAMNGSTARRGGGRPGQRLPDRKVDQGGSGRQHDVQVP